MSDQVLVLTTIGSEAHAKALASALVDARLAACVTVRGPVFSTYRWQGAVEQAQEYQLTIKTLVGNVRQIEQQLRVFHDSIEEGYELPELLVVPLAGGSETYLSWLSENSQPR